MSSITNQVGKFAGLSGREVAGTACGTTHAPKAEKAFYAVTKATELELDDAMRAVFQVGDELQRAAADWICRVPEIFNPQLVGGLAFDAVQRSMAAAQALMPGPKSSLAWQQVRNTIEVYNTVRFARSLLGIASDADINLERSVADAYALDSYRALWAIEGLGNAYGENCLRRTYPCRNLLSPQRVAVPEKSLLMLHAGLGVAFARWIMEGLTPYDDACRIARALQTFVTLCDENSQPGFVNAAYESLGLVVKTWHPQMIRIVDELLWRINPRLVRYLWHGAGRALYFVPLHIIPGVYSAWSAAEGEAPHQVAQLNMKAGLAWAATLVNMRQPAVLESVLNQQIEHIHGDDAFSSGVISAILVRRATTPDDDYLRRFLDYQPIDTHDGLAVTWDNEIELPLRQTLRRYRLAAYRPSLLGELFRYQPVNAVVEQRSFSRETRSLP